MAVLAPACELAAQVDVIRSDTVTLDLEGALAIADRLHVEVRSARAEAEMNSVEGRAAWLGHILPRVSVDLLETGYGGQLTRRFVDFVGNPVDNPGASWIQSSNTYQGLELTWTLRGPSPLDVHARHATEGRRRKSAVDAARNRVAHAVRRAWFRVQHRTERLAVEYELLAAWDTERAILERRFREEGVSKLDLLTAQLSWEEQRGSFLRAQRARAQAEIELRAAMGYPDLSEVVFVPLPTTFAEVYRIDEAGLILRGQAGSTTVQLAQLQVDAANIDRIMASRWRWPTARASYSWGRFSQDFGAQAFADLGFDRGDIQSRFSVSVTVPWLADPAGALLAESRAKVEWERQRAELELVRNETERRVRELAAATRDSRALLESMKSALGLATEALRMARAEYREGMRTFDQLAELTRREVTLRREVIDARYELVAAVLALEEAAGGAVGPSTGG